MAHNISKMPRQKDSGWPLSEEAFGRILGRERKRAERSGQALLLMLLDFSGIGDDAQRSADLATVAGAIPPLLRETDDYGWFEHARVQGIIFTDIPLSAASQAMETVEQRVRGCLRGHLATESYEKLLLSVRMFPEELHYAMGDRSTTLFYPEVRQRERGVRAADRLKRAMDVAGSLAALLLFSPLFVIVPALIKLTSKGPVLFRQERVGQYGKGFTFLKFRSMHVNNDDTIHREFIRGFIRNKEQGGGPAEAGAKVFKIQHDPRLTPIGNFLRKTSIDELPQFLNVLRGEMSLVGPRPPIPYEVDTYDAWHRFRILAGKPGITGLWQVRGRSRTTFDDMVRLDLQYVQERTFWLDLKLLLATPMAVIRGKGAY